MAEKGMSNIDIFFKVRVALITETNLYLTYILIYYSVI